MISEFFYQLPVKLLLRKNKQTIYRQNWFVNLGLNLSAPRHYHYHHHHIYLFIYLPSDVISQKKTATSSRSITKASKYAIPLKPTHKLAESKRYLVTW